MLFDNFPDGQSILGGAPFNVAWNLQGFGMEPEFVSAIGDDDAGRRITERMQAWQMSTTGMQTNEHPTGEVQVQFQDGQPSYEIVPDRAFDFLKMPKFPVTSSGFALLYVGSLASRNAVSRDTIRQTIAESDLPRFVDINIRQPWFEKKWLHTLLHGAHWVKLSDEELSELTDTPCKTADEIRAGAQRLGVEYGGENFFVTCGSRGAYAITGGELIVADAPTPNPMRDTVGAGDAFAATTIYGLLSGWDLQRTIRTATRFASRVCGLTGATSDDATLYQSVNDGLAT
ncbi:PfkB family carbohydrate kinase [Rosistilla oblonga]|uniref:2-dehydro-3-deoxygluconokinase n=1 Tax=Rosistilla oblonga TaxID=2527990 RepID=A0A518IXV6_9BACT|nr:PfkB family carbohydrate kinase [Rosistilla oblonga]QDV57916.1 2-dehydro-3-deoxygluconokinase [Rosistilla oblonga]